MISAPDGGKFLAGPSIANLCRKLKARDPGILVRSSKECLKSMIEVVCELEHSFCDLELVVSDVKSNISCLSAIRQVFDKARLRRCDTFLVFDSPRLSSKTKRTSFCTGRGNLET